MATPRFYNYLHRQMPVMMALSILPGLGYIFLGWMHDVLWPALFWYLLILLLSGWGYGIYREFDLPNMSGPSLDRWYRKISSFFYLFFLLWLTIFLIYIWIDAHQLHYIAIFTEIGASVVAAAILYPDRLLYLPTLLILMTPLVIYFSMLGEWYGYVLSAFSATLTWVLFYTASSSQALLLKSHHQASHDQLTGLYNHYFLINYMQQQMNSLREVGGHSYLLLIDLDHFKTVNDSLGHDVGDQLLEEVSARLNGQLPQGDVIARLGGDEFIIIGEVSHDELQSRQRAIGLAERLLATLKETYVINEHHIYISASIGISLTTSKENDANRFIREADIAMYEAKAGGRDGVILFDEELSHRVESNLEIERLLHFALEKSEFDLHYQPQIDRAQKIIGAECLVRWNNEKLGFVSPAEFIPIAEQTGLIIELGNFILERAFKTLNEWQQQGIELKQFSINISMRQFIHHSFIETVHHLSEQYLNDELRKKLIFEVTESVVAEDLGRIVGIMRQLQALDIRFSMDDFGTGYSSLSYLKQLPIDEIKIDRSFVCELDTDKGDQAMIVTILNIAEIFGPDVVAEGVETAAQFDFLLKHNCEIFQGYYFSRPLPKGEFEQFYRQQ
ncbi:diguanylate cyclase [Solemya pervernicosa gill symbiont]|uniref:Diguanylate cyclase n=3 Tax=Gammaproteobacteria incertae sedis TaxID=118884 RepID=A0A1T2L3Z8_9GAMM|nr:diguanylate cyclase [Solemya pervernicosa gill symbiont]